ncbi:DNA mismatch repair endonuclease MutL [Candidatus Bipolaricaulota bacterium]|nr:DNA mismatch repair endonuclease MutL [Candidatus Bipolaricaulota bacterium]
MKIHQLDDELASKIAAGEVIERPASVIKELIENAIDAKSERIAIELEDGGKRRILIRDDGDGMSAEDLSLCFLRHATSKLSKEADLQHITTLGFRGEALASIAAVTRLTLTTRARSNDHAYRLHLVGGKSEGPSGPPAPVPAPRGRGTTVEADDLFFNLPARLAFLGSARSELFHINRVVQHAALATPHISWEMSHNGRTTLVAPAVPGLRDRIAQIYGAELAERLLEVRAQTEDENGRISIFGYVTPPDFHRGNRRDQLFLINGRPVTDRGLGFVLSRAYEGLLRRGTYPVAVLRLDLSLETVDVNIHPRKEEVRFSSPRRVHDMLSASLQQAIASPASIAPILKTGTRETGQIYDSAHPDLAQAQTQARPHGDRNPSAQQPLDLHLSERGGHGGPVFETPPWTGQPSGNVRSNGHQRPFDRDPRSARLAEQLDDRRDIQNRNRRVVGQFHGTYILVETPDHLEIIDQHIAHERILYEALHRQWTEREIPRQVLLVPARIELPFESAEILQANGAELAELGVEVDAFGGGTFLVRAFPAALAESQARLGFQTLFEQLVDVLDQGASSRDAILDRLLSELACHAAIKAGDRLPLLEQEKLIEQWSTCEHRTHCPHGRPIVFQLNRDELDRRFQRK